uniref:AIP3 domain-containing protein n=2 Tax=Mesocestoides corti TaxID=53468 RepID=A0A5K3EL68_MESCO
MHSQTPSNGTPTRLPLHSTLLPATMQMGVNGERHLILHYPDGHTMAATAFPNHPGHFHLVPMHHQSQQNHAPLRLVQTVPDISHFKRQPPVSNSEVQTNSIKKKPGQKVELVCTCPPELHQALRQSQLEGTNHTIQPGDEEVARRLKSSVHGSLPCMGWANLAIQTDQKNSPSGESSETFQESDSSGGSGHANAFPSLRKGIVPPDVLLASVLNEQIKRPTKPPQTLEEAQHRIAYMENQLAQLTAWAQAVQTQGGLEDCSDPPSGTKNHPVKVTCPSGKRLNSVIPSIPEVNCTATHCGATNKCFTEEERTPRFPAPLSKQQRLLEAYRGLKDLRLNLDGLKQIHAANSRQMHVLTNTVMDEMIFLLKTSYLKGMTPVRSAQLALDSHIADYKSGYKEVETWLADLGSCIEELRVDALNRRCRVSVSEVEAYALHLSRLSQKLASFKGQIPELCSASTLLALANDAEVKSLNVLLTGEPKRLDAALSTCRQLTCTLFTLKRLAAVQENGISVNVPTFRTIRDPRPEDKKLYLQQISKIVPNHEARMMGLACHEKTRKRRIRLVSLRDSTDMEKSMEQSEDNLQSILRRVNELSLQLLPPCSEQSGEEEPTQIPPSLSLSSKNAIESRMCPIHQDSVKVAEECHNFCETQPPMKPRGKADGEGSSPSSDPSTDNSHQPPSQSSRGPRRAHVVFSRTVLVDAGRETMRLNCPSDMDDDHFDDTGDTGSEADELHPWRRERMNKGNRVVDIHPGLPRNEYIICDGRCGAPACAQGSCLARQKGSTGPVLKTTTAYGSASNERTQILNQNQRITIGELDSRSIDSEESEKHLTEPTSVHEMRTHHQCRRLNNANTGSMTN